MNWLKEQISISPSFFPLLDKISIIEETVTSNPSLCIEVCKCLIESLCKTILNNKQITYQDSVSFNRLVQETISNVLIPDQDFNNDLSELGRRVASVAQSLGELRNNAGFASHGMDINNPKFTDTVSLLSYKITGVIGGFIINCYNNNKTIAADSRIHYCDCDQFNEYFDDNNPLNFGALTISASKALYEQDYDAYKESYFEYLDDLKEIA